jgi:hypothetical protein
MLLAAFGLTILKIISRCVFSVARGCQFCVGCLLFVVCGSLWTGLVVPQKGVRNLVLRMTLKKRLKAIEQKHFRPKESI